MKPAHPSSASAEEQASLWAARLDGSALSAADRTALDAWLAADPAHRPLLSSYCQFSADLEQQLPLLAGIRDELVEAQTIAMTTRTLPWSLRPLLAGATLLAVAVVAAVFLWPARPQNQFQNLATPVAQRQAVTFADGTHVELNARTSLQVELGHSERRVRLGDGEAFFAVTKDPARPFIVETPAGAVRVTGTRFDVRSETAADLEVIVQEGSVQVRPGGTGTPVILKAGDRLSAGAPGVTVRPLADRELADALAWRRGQIVFAGTPLHEALARFARYHGRDITAAPDVAELRIGGVISLDDLDGFFTLLEEALPVQVTRNLNGTVQVGPRPGR